MKYKDVSVGFNKAWQLNPIKVDTMEKEFMAEIRDMMWHFSKDDDENINDELNSCYDSTVILHTLTELVEKFNAVYHIVKTTSLWDEDDASEEIIDNQK